MADKKKDGPKLLTKDDVLSADDVRTEIVEVPEWGGAVKVQALDAWEQSEYEQSLMSIETDGEGNVTTKSHMEGAHIRLAAMAIRNGDGKPMFSEKELKHKSGAAIKRIAERVREMSGMDAKSRKAAEGN